MTLLNLLMLLSDERYRRNVLSDIDDEVARMFWHREFPSWNRAYRTEALSAVQNKVRPFLMNTKIRAIVGQRTKPINLRAVIDDGKILIVNLSKGKLGEGKTRGRELVASWGASGEQHPAGRHEPGRRARGPPPRLLFSVCPKNPLNGFC